MIRLRSQAFTLLQGPIEALPAAERAEYNMALQLAPQLVLVESDPLRFLRFEHYDAAKAARGIARYWKIRKEIFGERWILPLLVSTTPGDDNRNSALSPRVMEALKTGVIRKLPDGE